MATGSDFAKMNRAVAKVNKEKATLERLELGVLAQRKNLRAAELDAYNAGVTQSRLAAEVGTSSTRMRENLRRAQSERDGLA